jgi:uncharacterized protein YcbK (DUF882 family)
MTRSEFRDMIQEFEAHVSCSESSGYRTAEHNKRVGGSANSAHLHGLAIDLILDSGSGYETAITTAKRLGFLGIEWDARNKHLHLDMHPTGRLWWVWVDLEGKEHSLSTNLTVV